MNDQVHDAPALRQRIEESFKISIYHLVKVFGCFFRNGLLVGSLAGRWSGLLAGTKRKNKQNTE